MPILYGIKNCDTIKKARSWLDANNIDYEFHDYKTVGIERELLVQWVQQVGWEALLNKRGTTYRKLPDSIKESLEQSSAIDVMLEQPSMIKRPVLCLGSSKQEPLVGFNANDYAAAMLK